MNQPQPVDDAVGQLGRDNFAAQPVAQYLALEFRPHWRGEILQQRRFHAWVVRQIAPLDRILQHQLGG